MKRFVTNLLTLMSLALLLAAAGMGARGYWATEFLWLHYTGRGSDTLFYSRGDIGFRHSTHPSVAGEGVGHDFGPVQAHYACRPPEILHANPAQGSYRHYGRWTGISWASSFARQPTDEEVRRAFATVVAATNAEAQVQTRPTLSDDELNNLSFLNKIASLHRWRLFRLRHSRWELVVPAWLIVALAAPLPIRWLVVTNRRRRSRRSAGMCHNCGYDLTGNESGVCPECGHGLSAGRPPGRSMQA